MISITKKDEINEACNKAFQAIKDAIYMLKMAELDDVTYDEWKVISSHRKLLEEDVLDKVQTVKNAYFHL